MTDLPRVELAPGYTIARVISGCWQLTPDHGGGPTGKDTLRRFAELVEHGFTTFDCADIYTGTEKLLGQFRRTLTDPDAIQVHTKLVPNKVTLAQLTDAQIDATIDQSRKRLGVERLDLVQFHWWDYEIAGLERLYERLLQAQSSGRIRLLGVTNFNTGKLHSLFQQSPSIVAMQAQYSLLDRRPERNMTKYCIDNNVALLPYGVLAGGFLSDKFRGKPEPGTLNRSLQKYRLIIDEAGGWDAFQKLLGQLADIAGKHRTGIDAIAARWALDRPGVAAIILGIGSRSRVTDNLALCQLQLDKEDQDKIADCLRHLTIPGGDPYDLERNPQGVHAGIIRTNLHEMDAAS